MPDLGDGHHHYETISTRYVPIPREDWPHVRLGRKTELRLTGRGTPIRPEWLPLGAVGYSHSRYSTDADVCLLIIESIRREMLGAISQESLHAEGFENLQQFREYWRRRNRSTGYRPLRTVQVLQIRPWRPEDDQMLGKHLLRRLYGRWMQLDDLD